MAEVEILPIPKPKLTADARNTFPLEIETQEAHGFIDGEVVYGCGHTGNLCANSGNRVNRTISPTEFSLYTVTGNPVPGDIPSGCGVYTGGGIFSVHREIQMNIPVVNGPWEHNGALYYLVEDHAGASQGTAIGLADQLSMMKRQPNGSWVVLDAANQPSRNTGLPATERLILLQVGCYKRGTTLWLCGLVDNPNPAILGQVFIQSFDFSTETWGAKINGGTDVDSFGGYVAGGSIGNGLRCVVSSDGTKIVTYSAGLREVLGGIDYDRPYVNIYDTVGGTWSSPIKAFGLGIAKYFGPAGCIIDNSDVVHLFCVVERNPPPYPNGSNWVDEGELLHRTISISGTLGGQSSLAVGLVTSDDATPVGTPIIYNDGIEDRIALFYLEGTIPGTPGVDNQSNTKAIHELNADVATLTWADATVSTAPLSLPPKPANQPNNGASATALNPVFNPASGELWLFWNGDQDLRSGDNPTEIFYAIKSPAGVWGAPVLWKTGNGLDPLWSAASTASIFEPGPLWYGNPHPVYFEGQVQAVYGKWYQNQVVDCATAPLHVASRVFEFPHFDVVDVCPPSTTGRKRYAYFRQLPC